MLRRGFLSSLCALLLWLGGCANHREPRSTVVFVPAPAPAATVPVAEPQTMVIEEPAPPPEPEEAPPPQNPEPSTRRRPRRPARVENAPEPEESAPAPATPEAPPAGVPALAPQQSSAQETQLRRQYLSLDQDIRKRLARFNGVQLSPNDQRTLDDARTFFAQSTHAMETGDLPRALNLARKAALLLAALE